MWSTRSSRILGPPTAGACRSWDSGRRLPGSALPTSCSPRPRAPASPAGGSISAGESTRRSPTRGVRPKPSRSPKGKYDWTHQAGERWFLAAAKARGVPQFLAFVNSPPGRMMRNGITFTTKGLGSTNLKPGFEGSIRAVPGRYPRPFPEQPGPQRTHRVRLHQPGERAARRVEHHQTGRHAQQQRRHQEAIAGNWPPASKPGSSPPRYP